MKRCLMLMSFVLSAQLGFAQIDFDHYFLDKSLRFDYYHIGNSDMEIFSYDAMKEEPYWGGSKKNLTDKFNYGAYKYELWDSASKQMIFSKTYCTLFNEWKTTAEAKSITKSFSESLIFPYPKKKCSIKIYSRDRKLQWVEKFTFDIDPESMFIEKHQLETKKHFKVHYSGAHHKKLDIVIIPEGYTKQEMKKFHKDCQKFEQALLGCSPFKEHQDLINIWGVEVCSEESGTDEPSKNSWKKTVANTSFSTFGSERYLTTTDNKSIRNIAAYAPYDQIFILVNHPKYGGGGIYNFYSTASVDNSSFNFLLVHEFGHAFAALGDEYYSSDVAVEDYHPLDVEPYEANLTTLIDFDSKWKDMLEEGMPIPTPESKGNSTKVGVYEGGGYKAKGVYRPYMNCTMKSVIYNAYCPVCQAAILEMLLYYSE